MGMMNYSLMGLIGYALGAYTWPKLVAKIKALAERANK
jgi:hypothetical protein